MAQADYGNVEAMSTIVGRAVKGVTCGIAPHRGRMETEEYRRNVPIWLRNRRGLPGDEVADVLRVQRPELGIETEDDLYQALGDAGRQRRDGIGNYQEQAEAYYQGERRVGRMQATTGMDPEAAMRAVERFAAAMELVDGAALDAVRDAWREAYMACGHKALARYLLTGDLGKATSKLAAKLAVN